MLVQVLYMVVVIIINANAVMTMTMTMMMTCYQVDGILAVHEFHIWQLAGDRIIASAHVRNCHLNETFDIVHKSLFLGSDLCVNSEKRLDCICRNFLRKG